MLVTLACDAAQPAPGRKLESAWSPGSDGVAPAHALWVTWRASRRPSSSYWGDRRRFVQSPAIRLRCLPISDASPRAPGGRQAEEERCPDFLIRVLLFTLPSSSTTSCPAWLRPSLRMSSSLQERRSSSRASGHQRTWISTPLARRWSTSRAKTPSLPTRCTCAASPVLRDCAAERFRAARARCTDVLATATRFRS